MHVTHLGTYAQARELCAPKRYAKKGRRLDNYTVIRLENRDTLREYIAFGHKRWNSARNDESIPKEVRESLPRIIMGPEFARFYPDNTVHIQSVNSFTVHQLDTLFSVRGTRDRHNYKVLKDVDGKMVLHDKPVVLKMTEPEGHRATIVDGSPVPRLEKVSDASTEWARAKRQFDRMFRCALKVGATFEDRPLPDGENNYTLRHKRTVDEFVAVVRSMSVEDMVHFLSPFYYRHGSVEDRNERLLEAYESYYNRHRRDILVAAGARVDAS